MRNWIQALSFMMMVSILSFSCSSEEQDSIVIMIGIDGLQAQAIDRVPAPNLLALAVRGVRAESMTPAMPTKTFVNFYSLATGLYPEHHGLISNYPYDRKLGRAFDQKTGPQEPVWWGGEPIWITAEKQGVKAGTYFWVGSEVANNDVRPTYWKPYQKGKDYKERVDEVLALLALPKKQRLRLVTLYFSAVDTAIHEFGVGSIEEREAIARVDRHIGDLIAGISELGLENVTNIVVVSDHGMANTADERVINIDEALDLSPFIIPAWDRTEGPLYGAFINLYGVQDDVDNAFQKLSGLHPKMQVLRRDDLPKNYHFNHPERGPDLMLLAETGWSLYASENKLKPVPMEVVKRSVAKHGYDNLHPSMQATFIAAGPAFVENKSVKPFENIEVYGLLACALNIVPAKTDGDIERVAHILKQSCKKG
jgi:predicted AlkP superfamily pyrophosphatase or phosphodiesterase